MSTNKQKVIVAGGGIGGLAVALGLAKLGLHIVLIEQAPEFKEIGAGIQLGPNAFAALDALGAGESARAKAVYTDHIIMKDAVNAETVVKFETSEPFRERFGNPYGVIHRADIHGSLLENLEKKDNVEFHPSTEITDYEETADGVKVFTADGREFSGDVLIGADGVRSIVRQKLIGDPARVSGHVVYRAVVPQESMPEELRVNAPFLWAGPHCHLVHYPLRGGKEYNLVVTFHSRKQEEWGATEGSQEEVLSYFKGIHDVPAQLLELPTSWTARETNRPWDLGKDFEESAVIGEVVRVDPSKVENSEIKLTVNGETKQESNIELLIWNVPEILEHLSQFYHLEAGDVIFTGTPEGVGPVVSGDSLEGTITNVGSVELKIK
ncbi:Kynurenine 3-monooxygenase [Oligella ureolytica]